jgi:hypothetical protein
MANEKLASLGYLKIGKEATRGVAVFAPVDVPLYSETIFPKLNLQTNNPIIGNPFGVYNIFPGQRDHQGDLVIMAEPKTLPHFLQMLLDRVSTTPNGSGVYTHLFKLGSPNASEASYTIDILKGDIVHRFYGCEIDSLAPEWNNDADMRLKLTISALGQVSIVPIASGATTSITLDTSYDPAPGKGLVVGDTLTIVHVVNGVQSTTEAATIAAISSDYLTLTVSTLSGSYSSGDYLYIAKRTVSPNIGTPFNWSRTEFRFGSTALAALSATHTPLEKGSVFEIKNNFEDNKGARRSGSYDPVSLVRKQGDATLTVKKFFNDGIELNDFLKINKRACVIRMFGSLISGTTFNELQITFNNMKVMESPDPLTAGDIIYLNQKLQPQYDTTDQQALSISVINSVSDYTVSGVPSSASSSASPSISPSASVSPSASKSPSASPSVSPS